MRAADWMVVLGRVAIKICQLSFAISKPLVRDRVRPLSLRVHPHRRPTRFITPPTSPPCPFRFFVSLPPVMPRFIPPTPSARLCPHRSACTERANTENMQALFPTFCFRRLPSQALHVLQPHFALTQRTTDSCFTLHALFTFIVADKCRPPCLLESIIPSSAI